MAKVELNPALQEIRGQLGNFVFRRTRGGQIGLMAKPNMSKVVWSPAQIAHRERFRQAAQYAKAALADPTARAAYERQAAASGKRPYDLAISDFFKGRNLLA